MSLVQCARLSWKKNIQERIRDAIHINGDDADDVDDENPINIHLRMGVQER